MSMTETKRCPVCGAIIPPRAASSNKSTPMRTCGKASCRCRLRWLDPDGAAIEPNFGIPLTLTEWPAWAIFRDDPADRAPEPRLRLLPLTHVPRASGSTP